MAKLALGAHTYLYPLPVVVVGALVDDKPTWMTIAYCGVVQHKPPMIEIASNRHHFTNHGIKETGSFSVNLPSSDMVELVDHIGLVSGVREDKSDLFTAFYGTLGNAPMAEECPINLECKLVDTLDWGGTNEVFIGEIVESYAVDRYVTDGLPDIRAIQPMVLSMHDNRYWRVGDYIGKAWNIGRAFKSHTQRNPHSE
jgi:flavin reductase (DIM6/NTAB) family NADH-FMN oxidoreductase RutF